MTVYVVSIGENHEGGKVQKLFASLDGARAFCENHEVLNLGDWEEVDFREWASDCAFMWASDCDFMIIEKIKVEA